MHYRLSPRVFKPVWAVWDRRVESDSTATGSETVTNQYPKLPLHRNDALLIFMDPLWFMPSTSSHALTVLVQELQSNMLMSNSILLECKDLPIPLIYPAFQLFQNSLT